MHILFADDSRATALPVIAYLEQQGHRLTYVQNGQEAVEAFRREPPDLVLLDVIMPVQDGIEATRQIKALGGARWIPVMLMTALSAKEEIVAGLSAGADDYLIKPIVFEVLEARMRSMQRIAVMQGSLFGILDNVYEAIITIDPDGGVQSFNRAAERIFGYGASEVIGSNVKRLMPAPYAEEHDGYLARYLAEGKPRIIGVGRKVSGLRKNGEVFPMQLAVTEITRGNERLFIGVVRDISAEEQARQRIEFLALNDTLTGLPNRTHFNEVLEQAIAGLQGQSHALLFIDLDGFKPINDRYGHEAGDEALKAVAGRLRHNLAAADFAARLGGDEFVAIVRQVADANAAQVVASRLIAAISQPMTLLGKECRMGASIGIALMPQHGDTASKILSAADHAMYAAKRAGKNCACLATAD